MEKSNLAQPVENLIEVNENLAFGHLGDVVHALASIVAHPSIRVCEAGQDRRDNLFEVASYFLRTLDCRQRSTHHTCPRAMAAAASPIRPPLRAWGWCTE
jgi:hypothetical protein